MTNPIQPLEPRRLLSAAVDHGVLTIEGTARADVIVLTNDSPRTLRVRVNATESTFLKRSFSKIRITAGRGDDLVTIGSDASPVALPANVTGDDGSDTLIGGAAGDSLSGGAGADQLAGGAGRDTLAGDNGNDDLHGGDGDDALSGGRGDDTLHDNAGDDKTSGNTGADLLYYDGAKPNKLRDADKSEKAYPEPTYPIKKRPHAGLVLNACPLDTVDGRHIPGGLIRAGGSTLVVAGALLKQWAGHGLETSNAFVPHFDLPGGGGVTGGVIISSGSINTTVTGIATMDLTATNWYTGATTVTGGTLTLNSGAQLPSRAALHLADKAIFTVADGAVVTRTDQPPQTVDVGSTLALTGPLVVTTRAGQQFLVDDGHTVTIIGADASTSPDYSVSV